MEAESGQRPSRHRLVNISMIIDDEGRGERETWSEGETVKRERERERGKRHEKR